MNEEKKEPQNLENEPNNNWAPPEPDNFEKANVVDELPKSENGSPEDMKSDEVLVPASTPSESQIETPSKPAEITEEQKNSDKKELFDAKWQDLYQKVKEAFIENKNNLDKEKTKSAELQERITELNERDKNQKEEISDLMKQLKEANGIINSLNAQVKQSEEIFKGLQELLGSIKNN